jgi:hypothetical protein
MIYCVSEDCRVAPGEPCCLERRKVVENRKNRVGSKIGGNMCHNHFIPCC